MSIIFDILLVGGIATHTEIRGVDSLLISCRNRVLAWLTSYKVGLVWHVLFLITMALVRFM